MPAPVDVSIFLNNALKATHLMAELESDTPLPEAIREMPERISRTFHRAWTNPQRRRSLPRGSRR